MKSSFTMTAPGIPCHQRFRTTCACLKVDLALPPTPWTATMRRVAAADLKGRLQEPGPTPVSPPTPPLSTASPSTPPRTRMRVRNLRRRGRGLEEMVLPSLSPQLPAPQFSKHLVPQTASPLTMTEEAMMFVQGSTKFPVSATMYALYCIFPVVTFVTKLD